MLKYLTQENADDIEFIKNILSSGEFLIIPLSDNLSKLTFFVFMKFYIKLIRFPFLKFLV